MTGHTGFKGSWLSLWLSMLGAKVFGFSLEPPSVPDMFGLIGLDGSVIGERGDIRDGEALCRAMQGFAPDLVVHMAAQPFVRRSYCEPVKTMTTNVIGTVNVLESIRQTPSVRAVINVTSDKCYTNMNSGKPFRETDPMGGDDPYSASKGCAELVAHSWRKSFFGDGPLMASVRAGNVIGGGDFGEDRLVPDMVRAFFAGKAVHIRSPKAVRPWQFVLEPLSGYLSLAAALLEGKAEFSGGWNFGPGEGDAFDVGQVVLGVVKRWGDDAAYVIDQEDHPCEAVLLRLDCHKARRELGWVSKTGIEVALDWTVEWYKACQNDPKSLRALTERQIRRFEEM